MKFDEQFPELTKELQNWPIIEPTSFDKIDVKPDAFKFILDNLFIGIAKHCLAKQKVKEAIGRVADWHIPVSKNATVDDAKKAARVIEDLLKELGLQD